MEVTLRDVAALAGVSVATASLALNNKPVNAETKEKVLSAARKLNYQPHYGGRVLKTGRSHIIGLYIMNQRENTLITERVSFFYTLLRGVMEAVNRAGYAFQFGVEWIEPQAVNSVFDRLLSYSIDGVIVLPQWRNSQVYLSKLLMTDIPHVVINPVISLEQSLQVIMDNRKGAELAIQHLAMLGYREIGLITGPAEHIDSIHRTQSYYKTMAILGLVVNPDWVRQGDFSIESGYSAMRQILAGQQYPRAVFCCNDYMASGAMRAVFENSLRVPDDIALVGFDDVDVASAVFPRLTTVKQPCFELGSHAVELLLERIAGNKGSYTPEFIQPTLVIRESCGAQR